MATETSSIDDLLAAQLSPSSTPVSEDMVDYDTHEASDSEYEEDSSEEHSSQEENEGDNEEKESRDSDEYGNPKVAERTYTRQELDEHVNKVVRERLAREERRLSQMTEQNNNRTQEPEEWKKELKEIIKETSKSLAVEEQQKQIQEQEAIAQAQFEQKFHSSMGKFNDFTEVVGKQPITDAMVIATREMKDPAAFLYAASKRAPQELSRISQIRDPYAQIAAMGALEISLKKTQPATKAPRPMSRTFEDGEIPHKSQREETIEDLIHNAERKKLAQANIKRR